MKKILTFLLLFSLSLSFLYSQGCSDAGVCSLDYEESENNYKISLTQSFGLSDEVAILTSTLKGKFKIYDTYLTAHIPFVHARNRRHYANGIGDILLSLGIPFQDFILNAGTKIATNNADNTYSNTTLPMAFQSSQATNDLLFTLNYKYENYKFTIGYQHVLSSNVKNHHIIKNTNDSALYSTYNLKRGNDIMLSAISKIEYGDFSYTYGTNLIYRLSETSSDLPPDYKIMTVNDTLQNGAKVNGSDGLTMNLLGSMHNELTDYSELILDVGFPIIYRKNIIDGLKRNFQLNITFAYSF